MNKQEKAKKRNGWMSKIKINKTFSDHTPTYLTYLN